MKAYLVTKTFADGSKEGVFFTDNSDANLALSGVQADGSTLANEWCEIYGGDDGIEMTEIEI